jgi:hypothetical protein
VLGNANNVVPVVKGALLEDPNRLFLAFGVQIGEIFEALESEFGEGRAFVGLIEFVLYEGVLQILTIASEYTFYVLTHFGAVVEALDHIAPETVHDRQSFSEQYEDDTDDEHHGQDHFVLDVGCHSVDFILERPFHIECYQQLEGDHEGAADQDNQLHLVDAFDDFV